VCVCVCVCVQTGLKLQRFSSRMSHFVCNLQDAQARATHATQVLGCVSPSHTYLHQLCSVASQLVAAGLPTQVCTHAELHGNEVHLFQVERENVRLPAQKKCGDGLSRQSGNEGRERSHCT